MTAFKDRTGDFTNKTYLYKFYKNGYTSRQPKYITAGQYMGSSFEIDALSDMQGSAGMDYSLNWEASSIIIVGTGDSQTGLDAIGKVTTDRRRQIDIKGVRATFSSSSGDNGGNIFGYVHYVESKIFDYRIRVEEDAATVFYKDTELGSIVLTEQFLYTRLREDDGTMYIEYSLDGEDWTAWVDNEIDFDNDIIRDELRFESYMTATGPATLYAVLNNIEITDSKNQLLAIETEASGDLEFDEQINTPASATDIELPYDPLNVPSHCDIGNFVETYVNFFDNGLIQNEPILDQNSEPILDQNSEPIYGVVLLGNIPEEFNILKFSGYIDSIDYDYDNGTIILHLVSHGEVMSNSIVSGDEDIDVSVISQTTHNSTESTNNRRQTFTLAKSTKVDAVAMRVSATGGGGSQAVIGSGNTTIAASHVYLWSGSLSEQELTYRFDNSLYLEAGTYWVQADGVSWRYQNSNVLDGGSRQQYSGGSWSNVTGDAYLKVLSQQPDYDIALSGDSQAVAQDLFERSLRLDYAPLYLDDVEQTDYSININLNIDTAKNALQALYRQLPTGWFYHIDIGTGAIRIKDRNAEPDHLLVYGRDFTGMKVTKDITDIVNEVYYIGGDIAEDQKLTIRVDDPESIAEYRKGLTILSNDKVTRYDTAALFANNTIANNNTPRLTTEITLSALKYNIEAVRIGDVIKIVNGDTDVLAASLVVASINYSPNEITISLDSAPRNISRTIDAIQRDLENQSTAAAASVI